MLKGEKTENGTGKVLKSTEKDNVFVYFADHGAKVDLKKLKLFSKIQKQVLLKQFPTLNMLLQYFIKNLNDFLLQYKL